MVGLGRVELPTRSLGKQLSFLTGFEKFWILIDSFSSCKTDESNRVDSF